MYSVYVSNFNQALHTVDELSAKNPAFHHFLKTQNSHQDCHGLVFQAFLILPVQRIPRYRLLLTDYLKNTPQNHTDYENIEQALASVTQVADFVNETIRDREKIEEMLDIQRSLVGLNESLFVPGRRFVKRGRVQKVPVSFLGVHRAY
jgi:hypothetical protein